MRQTLARIITIIIGFAFNFINICSSQKRDILCGGFRTSSACMCSWPRSSWGSTAGVKTNEIILSSPASCLFLILHDWTRGRGRFCSTCLLNRYCTESFLDMITPGLRSGSSSMQRPSSSIVVLGRLWSSRSGIFRDRCILCTDSLSTTVLKPSGTIESVKDLNVNAMF